MLLNNIALFLQIVEKDSLAAAGREAGLSPTTVSERLATLEAHYGVVLLNRTTRAISLTDEGRTLAEGAKLVLGEVEDLETRIRLGAETLSGPIRISASNDIGRAVVAAEVNRFLSEHPAISIELLLLDGFVDIVGEGVDIALRLGPTTDSKLRVRSLGQKRRVLCAAPTISKPTAPRANRLISRITIAWSYALARRWTMFGGLACMRCSRSSPCTATESPMTARWYGSGVLPDTASC